MPRGLNFEGLRRFYDADYAPGRSDAACALTHGERASGHKRSYWGGGLRNEEFTAYEFVANLTAARYTKDKVFFELFNPLAQEVQDLLDSYEP